MKEVLIRVIALVGVLLVAAQNSCKTCTQQNSVLDCTFENGWCGYTVLKNQTPGLYDVMEWRLANATEKQQYFDIKLLTYGPDVDHTTGQPFGAIVYAVRPINPHTNTTLLSPVATGHLCYLEFFYQMGSVSLKSLIVYMVKYGQWIKLATYTGYQGDDWNRALLDIDKYTEFGEYQIAIVATEPDAAYWTIGYALDDIRGLGCNMPVSCNFEKDMCNFLVERNTYYYDRMEWLRGQPSIDTWFGKVQVLRDGPTTDHTNSSKNGWFIYAEKPLASHTNTTLVSPKQTSQLCYLEFYYFMNNKGLGNLDVNIRYNGTNTLQWRTSGAHGNTWNRAEVKLQKVATQGSYEITIFASEPTGSTYSIGYAVDDINAYPCVCDTSPCWNGGICQDRFNNFTCTCPTYFSGTNCEINLNPCAPAPCQNEAQCTALGVGNYTCQCTPGWTGKNCETDIDECASNPCQHDTICFNDPNSFSCYCFGGYTGTTCEIEINECDSNPCFNGACTDLLDEYNCSCIPGFTGEQCDVNIDECASNPCQNGGFCFDQVDGYVCVCLKDFTGNHCEVRKMLDCDFSNNTCGYTIDPAVAANDSHIHWQRGPASVPGLFGSQPAVFLGPSTDHSGNAEGYFLYALEGSVKNATTTFSSPLSQGELCYLQFFYHMGGLRLSTLNVYLVPENGTRALVFTKSGSQGFDWLRAVVDIERYTMTGRYQVVFEVTQPDGDFAGGVGYVIDDIRGLGCNMDMNCDFEEDLCNLYVEMNTLYYDRMEWRRGQAELESVFSSYKLLRNGPDFDHSTGNEAGYFVYALRPVNDNTTTTLVAPLHTKQMCFFSFWYHMGSESLGNLSASVRKDNETIELFRVKGFQGTNWNQIILSIENATKEGRYELTIQADQPEGDYWTVGYAVDDISVSPCFCEIYPCQNGATCVNHFLDYSCECPYLWGGQNCSEYRTPCSYNPCANGGVCLDKDTDFTCVCAAGWEDDTCTTNIDECLSNPCQNMATCQDGVNSFTCSCPSGFYGDLCQYNVDECVSRPCLNGATCVDGIDSYTCSCAGGFFGIFCQFEINECLSSPCIHGGTCIDDINFFRCNCPAGYTGSVCELEIDECDSSPCQNGGLCQDHLASYECFCHPGYTGTTCARDINECLPDPCLNGATCVDMVNDYRCTCTQGFTGENCQTDINECSSNPCRNGGVCLDKVGAFKCNCTSQYTGDTCEKSLVDCGLDPCGS